MIGNITDVVRTVDGETMITLDTGHTFQFKSYDIYWDKGHNCFINKPYYRGTLNTAHAKEATAMNAAAIKNVIFAPPATIVYWSDGSKTVVKCSEKDVFDRRRGWPWRSQSVAAATRAAITRRSRIGSRRSGKKYPGKTAAGKAVDLDVLKKYSSEANKDCEKFLSAVMSNNQSGILLHLTALVADLKILENEINK